MIWFRTKTQDYLAYSQMTNQLLFPYHFPYFELTILKRSEPGAEGQDTKEVGTLGREKGP